MNNVYRDDWGNVLTDMAPIQQDVKFGKNVRLGVGVIIEEGCEIGDNCFIDHYTVIRPGVTIGNDSEIHPFCFIAEGVKIGSNVKISCHTNLKKSSIIEDNKRL